MCCVCTIDHVQCSTKHQNEYEMKIRNPKTTIRCNNIFYSWHIFWFGTKETSSDEYREDECCMFETFRWVWKTVDLAFGMCPANVAECRTCAVCNVHQEHRTICCSATLSMSLRIIFTAILSRCADHTQTLRMLVFVLLFSWVFCFFLASKHFICFYHYSMRIKPISLVFVLLRMLIVRRCSVRTQHIGNQSR